MKKAILALSLLFSANASATQHVFCDIGMQIMYQGKKNHLNLVHVRGMLLNDDHDKWHVNFKYSLPSEYTYLEGPDFWVNGNSCTYDEPIVTYDGN